MQQVTIFREAQRYAGWPANYGIWCWGDEIVLGFTRGYHASRTDSLHTRDTSRPFINVQARSLDGGRSWVIEEFPGRTPGNRGLSADEHMLPELGVGAALDGENAPTAPPGGIDFLHPDFALMGARTGLEAGVRSFFYVSYDRCHSWQGPYWLPTFGQTGVAARTDYLVEGRGRCLLFLTANKRNGSEGRVFCARTRDGGQSFEFVAYIGAEPAGATDFAIMPASLRLPSGRILCAVRCRAGERSAGREMSWLDLYASDDDAATWQPLARPVTFRASGHPGNPPTLNRLPDGRLVLVYGNRDQPYTMAARLSADDGQTWGDEITLRGAAGSPDLGYPRTVILADGTVVTAYYFNDRPDGDGERFIEATRWQP